jgi:hypothetical protein
MMKLLGNGNVLTTLAIGAGVALAAPVVIGIVGGIVRLVAKAAIKGGIIAFEKIKETGAETVEVIGDLAAEAKSEVSQSQSES